MDNFPVTLSSQSSPEARKASSEVVEQPPSPGLSIDINPPAIGTEIALLLMLAVWKFVVEPFKEKVYRRLSYSLEDETNISLVMAQILAITKADRITLLEFHNGEVARGGRHLNKLSPTKEVVGPGLAKVRSMQGTILVNVISGVISKLEATPLLKTEVNNLAEGYCKNSFFAIGSHYVATTLVKDSEGPIAVLMIEYHEQDPCNFNALKYSDISINMSELVYILTKSKRQWIEVLKALLKIGK